MTRPADALARGTADGAPVTVPDNPTCRRCGHPRDWHEHYRPGTDCGTCGRAVCPAYRPRRWWQW